ncbi:MAG: EamA family transporter, partial [Candidatus Limnocylindria bacterium]
NGLVMLAEREVPSGLAALIIASVPLWVLLFRLLAGQRVARLGVIGVLAGLAGVALLVVPTGLSGAVGLLSLLFIVVAPLSWAWGSFMSTRIALPRDAFVSTALQQLLGGVFLLAAGLLTGEAAGLDADAFAPRSLVAWLYLVTFGSLLAFSAYTWLLQHAPVSTVATYAYVNPVVAVFLGTLVLAEPITPTIVVGATVVLVAVALIVRAPRARVPEAPAAEGASPAE